MHKIIALASIALLGSVSAKISSGTNCPTPSLQRDFDPHRYTGTWFQAAKDLNSPFENGNCAQTRYSLMSNGSISVLSAWDTRIWCI